MPLRFPYLVLALTAAILACRVAGAQEMGYGGAGAINHALAGTAAALPHDSAGAVQWNPAALADLPYSDIQFAFGRHNPPWYGDEIIAYPLLAAALFTAVVVTEGEFQDDGDWSDDHDLDVDTNITQKSERKIPKIRVPSLSFAYRHPDSRWTYALGVSEYGALKIGSHISGERFVIAPYRFQGYEFTPAVSYRISKQWAVGFAPVFSIDETANSTLPLVPGGFKQDDRSKFGAGLQGGLYYKPGNRFAFGVSVRSPQWIKAYSFRWTDPTSGEARSERFSLSQDSATRLTVGGSYRLPNKKTFIAADFRYYDYSHTSALYDLPASFDTGVKRLGASRNAKVYAVGLEHPLFAGERPLIPFTFRCGYAFCDAAKPAKYYLYNTSLPLQSGHSIHYGVSFPVHTHCELAFSLSHTFGGREQIAFAEETVSFRRSPNRNNFWLSLRMVW